MVLGKDTKGEDAARGDFQQPGIGQQSDGGTAGDRGAGQFRMVEEKSEFIETSFKQSDLEKDLLHFNLQRIY